MRFINLFVLNGFVRLFFLLLVIGLTHNTGFAQSTGNLDMMAAKLDSIASVHLDKGLVPSTTFDRQKLAGIFGTDIKITERSDARISLLNAQKSVLDQDLGLSLNADYLENLDQGVFGVDGIFYQRRAQLGVKWDILNNGLYENKSDIQEIENEINIARQTSIAEARLDSYQSAYEQLLYHFNHIRLQKLESFLSLLDEQLITTSALYEMKYISLENVLRVNTMQARVENKIMGFERYNSQFGELSTLDLEPEDLPLFDIDLQKLLNNGLIYFDELEELYSKTEFQPLNELSLSTFLRYNLFGGTNGQGSIQGIGNREFFSAGISLSLPLPLSTSKKRNVHDQEQRIRKLKVSDQKRSIRTQILDQYKAYQSLLNEYLISYQNYLIHEDLIRSEKIKRSIGSDAYSPQALVSSLAERYTETLQLLDLKEQLYTRLLRIQSLIPGQSILDYLITKELQTAYKSPGLELDLYIWSNSLERYSTDTILTFLNDQKVKNTFISSGVGDKTLTEVEAIIKERSGTSGKIHLMIGDPNFIFEDHRDELTAHIEKAISINADGIHLDVEPHTFDDWQAKRSDYLEQYLAMLSFAREKTSSSGIELSVSVPLMYEDIMQQISRLTDRVVVMTYEIDTIEEFSRRTAFILSIPTPDISIALRTQDFADEAQMINFAENIYTTLGFNNIVIHDLDSWIDLINNVSN